MPRGVYARTPSPRRITAHIVRFEIECGRRLTVQAESPRDAWEIFCKKVPLIDRAQLVRFREVPWNATYSWDKAGGGHHRMGQWYYCDPCWFTAGGGMPELNKEAAPRAE